MGALDLSSLLILQDRDSRCEQFRRQVEQFPRERAEAEEKIKALRSQREKAQTDFQQLEVKRKVLEGEVADAEEKIRRYRTQQLSVKKVDEFEALNHEIAALEKRISETEDAELELLEAIDSGKVTLERVSAEIAEQITLYEHEIARLNEAEVSARTDLKEAEEALESARADIAPSLLDSYTAVRRQVKRGPWVVPVKDSRCQGCHIKVSGDVESEARRGHQIVRCDNCSRIVFWER
ncbi:MAG: hypothetical protein JJT96_12280 [Opitutales bacterium]|nr:hypothetical protein [Opitutales bacterium]